MTDTDVGAQNDKALSAENDALRARVAELEHELAEQAQRTNALVARTQERVYWLDRYHLDLNALMALPGMSAVRALLRGVRAPVRLARQAKRRLLG